MDIAGPGTESDPFAGIESGLGVLASAFRYDASVMDRAAFPCHRQNRDRLRPGRHRRRHRSWNSRLQHTDAPTISTAEHAIALLLAATKGVVASFERLRAGQGDLYSQHEAIELDGKTLGLVGFGRIARRVAAVAQSLGMNVVAFDPLLAAGTVAVPIVDDLDDLLRQADIVSVHVPLTSETNGLFDRRRFEMMKPGSFFINTSRGGVVDQESLVEALDSGHLRGAGLDVTDPEPLPPNHPLLHRPNVLVTPHVASATIEGRRRIFLAALAQMVAVLDGEKPEHLINPEVWTRRRRAAK